MKKPTFHILVCNSYRIAGEAQGACNKKGAPEFQIIVSYNKPEDACALYRDRWQLETSFKALKSSGFNIEDTHLTDLERLKK